MQPITSTLEGKQGTYGDLREQLSPEGFSLANWEYDGGYFDRKLDESGMVFLRIPVVVREGELDNTDALLEVGQPFVLKHVYQTGNDPDTGYMSSHFIQPLINQFQEPVEKDAPIEGNWVNNAEDIVRRLEQTIVFV